jgi:hypothetical protein
MIGTRIQFLCISPRDLVLTAKPKMTENFRKFRSKVWNFHDLSIFPKKQQGRNSADTGPTIKQTTNEARTVHQGLIYLWTRTSALVEWPKCHGRKGWQLNKNTRDQERAKGYNEMISPLGLARRRAEVLLDWCFADHSCTPLLTPWIGGYSWGWKPMDKEDLECN